jgi:hypothetical protein
MSIAFELPKRQNKNFCLNNLPISGNSYSSLGKICEDWRRLADKNPNAIALTRFMALPALC